MERHLGDVKLRETTTGGGGGGINLNRQICYE